MQETYLTLEKVNSLLGEDFKIDIENKIERSLYRRNDGGVLPVVNSKRYEGVSEPYWFSCITDHFEKVGATHICLTCGNEGILMIPINVMLEYNKHSGWKTKTKKGKAYHVRITIKNGRLNLHSSSELADDIDVTEYYIKYNP